MADTLAKRTTSTPASPRHSVLEDTLLTLRKSLTTTYGDPQHADAFIVEILNMGRRLPALHTCDQESLAYGIMRLASLRLNPAIPNEAWLIPRGNKAEVQYGYGGLRKLVMRSAEVIDCFSREVCQNDTFVSPATPISLPTHQIPPFTPRGRVIGYYNVIQKANGNFLTLMMSVVEIEAHRDRYAQQDRQGQYGSAWSRSRPDQEGLTNFDKMALKTVLRMNCNPRNVGLEAEVWSAIKGEGPGGERTTVTVTPPRALSIPSEPVNQETGEILTPQKVLEAHIADLYGDRGKSQHPLEQEITQALQERGLTPAAIQAFWQVRRQKYPDLTPAALGMIRDEILSEIQTTPVPSPTLWDAEDDVPTP